MTSTRILTPLLLAFAAANAAAQGLLPTQGEVLSAVDDPILSQPGVTIGGSGPFDTPVMDLDGNVLFRARLLNTTGGTLTERGMFFGRANGDVHMFLQAGDQEPSLTLPGVTLNTSSSSTGSPTGAGLPSSYMISPYGGLIMFGASLNGPGVVYTGTGTNSTAIYWGTPNALVILARRGDLAPSGGSTLNTSFSSISQQASALSGQGVAVFKSALTGGDVNGTENDNAWIIGTPGNLQFLIREGDTLLNGDVAIATLGFNAAINDAGMVVHDETLSTTLGTNPATANDDKVILLTLPGNVHNILMREGDAAPGTVGAIYSGSPTLAQGFSQTGQTAFYSATANGDTVPGQNDGAIFAGGLGGVQMVVRKGDAITGLAVGENLATITTGISYTDNGGVAFVGFVAGANVTSDNDAAIFAGTAGNVRVIAREGDPAPGVPGGVIGSTSGGGIVNGTGTPKMNERGQIMFQPTVLLNSTNYNALYSYDPVRGLELQLLQDESFGSNVNTQQVTNISGPLQFPSGDSSTLGFNNNGDFITRPFFTATPAASSLSAIVKGHIGAMQATPTSIPGTGGTQSFQLDAGVANAGFIYLIAGTASGTRPGLPFQQLQIPLNVDFWFNGSLAAANSAMYANSFGFLDAQGKASASFNFPNYPAFAGLSLNHAFVVLDPSTGPTMVSEPTSVLIY
ncbi:MAG: hypothetical protein H6838_09555 [Planctomycetes bacterium]|nr:hypothetical protein [Planctomycetota bacterium]MCB9885727.1 hypothetical protein [Planctomycetota bacterium]